MLRRHLFLATFPLFAAACGNAQDAPTQPITAATAGASAATTGALGLTEAQLRDADLIDAAGVELGEVEDLVRGSDGAITGVLIEIKDSDPDRFVQLPIQGLEAVKRGDDRDLRSDTSRERLMALPEVSPR